MNSIFKFKRFEVDQAGCAMKINTDGVLLALLAESDAPKRILDIGTGTGVLALMLAQRFENATVVAVEIDESAAVTAKRNFEQSVFYDRLNVVHSAIEDYIEEKVFDLIISNPPFFVNDLKSAEERKGIARHADQQFFSDLIKRVNLLLAQEGRFWFILPIKQAVALIDLAVEHGFFLFKQIELHSDESKPAFRWIVSLTKQEVEVQTVHFYIYQSERVYTAAYRDLLKDFFLAY